jgi:thymidine phosphorylase
VALVEAQDGNAAALAKMTEIHRAPVVRPLLAKSAGVVTRVDAETIGRASLLLGGGRQKADDSVDFTVGFSDLKKTGERVRKGEPLCVIHARSEAALSAILPMLETAFEIN